MDDQLTGSPRRQWLAAVVGLVFACAGLAALQDAVVRYGEMSQPWRTTYVAAHDAWEHGGYAAHGGFAPGLQGLLATLFVAVGVGVGCAGLGLHGPAARAGGLVIAGIWLGVGAHAGWSYWTISPEHAPSVWFLLAVWASLGLVPLGLSIADSDWRKRVRAAVLSGSGHGILGASLGAFLGGMAGGVVAAISTSQGIGLAGVDWWAYGGLYGTASGAALGFILRLAGAPMPWMGRHAVGPRTDVPPSLPPSASGMQPRGAWGNRVPQRVGPGLQAAGVVLFLVGMTTGSWEPLLKRTAPTAHGLLNDATGGGGLGLLGWTLVIAGFVVILAGKVLAGIRGDPDR